MTTTSEQLFDHVTETIHQRGAKYGHPYPQHKRIAELWSAYLGYPITANQVAMCMAMVKISIKTTTQMRWVILQYPKHVRMQ